MLQDVVTDAIGKCMLQVGLAADVYLGQFDGPPVPRGVGSLLHGQEQPGPSASGDRKVRGRPEGEAGWRWRIWTRWTTSGAAASMPASGKSARSTRRREEPHDFRFLTEEERDPETKRGRPAGGLTPSFDRSGEPPMYQRFIAVGRLGRNPEISTTAGGPAWRLQPCDQRSRQG